ncbi:YdcF family protein [Virgibacillus sp. 179-BFC.A HS]|uniref:YdcF family protein n=1 Tax=Tigheibacillus jepli TaxID=3035914 RepID=A0ABU5CJ66_9BACI|nr:YdcF family protein [Virgibacillus sp. 179-BFC.A HS]MDY0406350.1 YdcF family protein [Virgibacillus sp. 179-BFC.A HS]
MKRKWIFIALPVVFAAGLLFCIYAHYQIKKTAAKQPPPKMDYVIILGAKVNGTVMSKSLLYRVQMATNYLNENPQAKVIATGGMGKSEDVTEAKAIADYLIAHGISKDRILLEERSTSTKENLEFTKRLYPVKEAVIVSNDFHLYRSVENAKALGIKAYPLAAKTPKAVAWKLYLREYAAILKMKITGQ